MFHLSANMIIVINTRCFSKDMIELPYGFFKADYVCSFLHYITIHDVQMLVTLLHSRQR